MVRRSLVMAITAGTSLSFGVFLSRLTAELDRRFGFDVCRCTVQVLDEDIVGAEELNPTLDVCVQVDVKDATVSYRTLRLAFFGFCLHLFEDASIQEVKEMVPSIGDVGAVEKLVDRFIRFVGGRVNITIDEGGEWRVQPEMIVEAAKLLPFFPGICRVWRGRKSTRYDVGHSGRRGWRWVHASTCLP